MGEWRSHSHVVIHYEGIVIDGDDGDDDNDGDDDEEVNMRHLEAVSSLLSFHL
jgi:hypothetical protein